MHHLIRRAYCNEKLHIESKCSNLIIHHIAIIQQRSCNLSQNINSLFTITTMDIKTITIGRLKAKAGCSLHKLFIINRKYLPELIMQFTNLLHITNLNWENRMFQEDRRLQKQRCIRKAIKNSRKNIRRRLRTARYSSIKDWHYKTLKIISNWK